MYEWFQLCSAVHLIGGQQTIFKSGAGCKEGVASGDGKGRLNKEKGVPAMEIEV